MWVRVTCTLPPCFPLPSLSVSTLEQKIVISMSEVRQRTHRVARLFDAFSSFSLFLFQKCRTHLPGISRVQRAVATSLVIVQFSGHLVHLQSPFTIVECCLQTGKAQRNSVRVFPPGPLIANLVPLPRKVFIPPSLLLSPPNWWRSIQQHVITLAAKRRA